MSLRINNNIASVNGQRNLIQNNAMISKSLEKLSSGLNINRAADDAAGLIISEQMRAQITGLSQAIDNAETAVAMVQTAEGALDEMNSLLNKARELAVSAANEAANDSNQIAANQDELNAIIDSISRIADNTQFGTKKILDGTLGLTSAVESGTGITVNDARGLVAETYSTALSTAGTEGTTSAAAADNGALAASFGSDVTSFTFGTASALKADDYDLTVDTAGTAGSVAATVAEGTQNQGTLTGQLVGATISDMTNDDYADDVYAMANQTAVATGSTSAQLASTMNTAVGTVTTATDVSDLATTDTLVSGQTLTLSASDGSDTFSVAYTHNGANWTISTAGTAGDFSFNAAGIANNAAYGTENLGAIVADFSAKLAAADYDAGDGAAAGAFTASVSGGAGSLAFGLTATDHGSYSNNFDLTVNFGGTSMTTREIDGSTVGSNLTSAANSAGADASFELQDSSGGTLETFTTTVADTRAGSQTAFTGDGGNTITLAGNLTAGAGGITLSSNDLRAVVNDLTDGTDPTGADTFSETVRLEIIDSSSGPTTSVYTMDASANTSISQALATFNNQLNNDTNDIGVTIGIDSTGADTVFSLTANETGTYANGLGFRIVRDGDDTTLFATDSADDGLGGEVNSTSVGTDGVNTAVSLAGVGDAVNNTVALTAVDNRGNQNFEAGSGTSAVTLNLASAAQTTSSGSQLSIGVADIRDVTRVTTAANVDNSTTLTGDVTLTVGGTSVTTAANGGNTVGTALSNLNTQLVSDGVGAEVSLDDSTGTFTVTALDRGTYSDDLNFSLANDAGTVLFATTEIDGGGTAVSSSGATNTRGIDAVVTLTGQDDSSNVFTVSADRYDETSASSITFDNIDTGTSLSFSDGTNLNHATGFTSTAESFQIGANRDQTIDVAIFSMRAQDIGKVDSSVLENDLLTSLESLKGTSLIDGYAQDAISIIDAAIDDVTNTRGDLGAIQANALETTVNSLRVTRENLTAAESTIRDVNFAEESAEFTKNNILIQASTAMLAQANQLPQNVLQLLG